MFSYELLKNVTPFQNTQENQNFCSGYVKILNVKYNYSWSNGLYLSRTLKKIEKADCFLKRYLNASKIKLKNLQRFHMNYQNTCRKLR